MRSVLTFVLGGGRGTRLYPLTKYRSKPAVPLAGKYRLIDIPLSNCINSQLNRIYVLTQFLSVSLHRHIRQTYRFDAFSGGFVEILAAQQTMDGAENWYQGTADAVRKNMRYLEQPGVRHVLILSGDQLYRMDYRDMLRTHTESGADVTIAGIPVSREAAGGLGIMRLDEDGRAVGFLEKPQASRDLDIVRTDPAWIDRQGVASQGRDCVASMGIYIFNRDKLLEVLQKTDYQDFGREIFPAAVRTQHVQLHLFDGYWEDIGTIRAFYDANLALAAAAPPFDLSCPDSPIYSRARFLPPTRVDGTTIRNSLIAEGCQIGTGTTIENSIVGVRCVIGNNVTIRNSVLMGSDEYEGDHDRKRNLAWGRPPTGVGNGSMIEGAIVDKNCHIGQRVRIVPPQGDPNQDLAEFCAVRDGVPVIIKDGVVPDGWQAIG